MQSADQQNVHGQPWQRPGPHLAPPSASNQSGVAPHVLLPGVSYQLNNASPLQNVSFVPGPPYQYNLLQPWTTGLCDCCDDCGSCCLTCWCPCVTFGRIANVTDRGMTSCCGSGTLYCILCLLLGFHWVYSCVYRGNLRKLYNLPETPCCDCCVQYCCECCSLSQMYRELQNRGYNMSTGNLENMPRLVQVNMQPPQVPGPMTR